MPAGTSSRPPGTRLRSADRGPIRRLWPLALLAGLAWMLASCGGDATPRAATGSCDAYATQEEAQRAADTKDGDGDGRFCERLPCPCLGPDGRREEPGIGQASGGRPSTPAPRSVDEGSAQALRASVSRVIDGDTIDAQLADGTRQRVRLLGIDTPESSALRSGSVECGGREATRAADALARRWPDVILRTDPTQDTYDRYDRLLAYVEPVREPTTSFQRELLLEGWAKVYVYEDPPARVDAFRAAAEQARRAREGVWSRCGGEFRRPIDG